MRRAHLLLVQGWVGLRQAGVRLAYMQAGVRLGRRPRRRRGTRVRVVVLATMLVQLMNFFLVDVPVQVRGRLRGAHFAIVQMAGARRALRGGLLDVYIVCLTLWLRCVNVQGKTTQQNPRSDTGLLRCRSMQARKVTSHCLEQVHS